MHTTSFPGARKPLAVAVVLAAIGCAPAHAATITVDTFDDVIGNDTSCSLREAVITVNQGAAGVTDCVVDETQESLGTNDILSLPAGIYTLSIEGIDEDFDTTAYDIGPNIPENAPTVVNTPDATVGDLDIGKRVSVVGAGADTTSIQWSAAATTPDRIFHVYSTAPAAVVDVSIDGVTLTGGKTTEEAIGPGPASGSGDLETTYYLRRAGGAIAVGPAAAVVLVDPNIEGQEHSAGRGGSQRPDDPDEGGATFSLSLNDVVVDTNNAGGDGGGIYTAAAMSATGLVVSNNTALTNGGGIYNEGNTSITVATISGNEAEGGGGMFLTGSNTVDINGATFSGNRAIGGGAISGRSSVLVNMVNSTLSGNLAQDVGAGFYSNGDASLRFVTIANNVSGSDSPNAGSGINTFGSQSNPQVTIKSVLLAANKRGWDATAEPDGPTDPSLLIDSNCGVTGTGDPAIVSNGYNLSSDVSCWSFMYLSTDINNVAPLIGPLVDNGGPTQTHALLAGSPAIGAGGSEPDVSVDQRGVTRDTPPDIGAYEVPSTSANGGGGGCSIGTTGRSDPLLPAFLLAALAAIGLRRRPSR